MLACREPDRYANPLAATSVKHLLRCDLYRYSVANRMLALVLSFNLLALLFISHASMPKARSHTSNYFKLAYYNPNSGQYGLGKDDGYFIFFCVVLFTGLRAATMEYLLAPFAKAKGIAKRKDITRFSEQAWLFIYYSVFWTLGMVWLCDPPWTRGQANTQEVSILQLHILDEPSKPLDRLAAARVERHTERLHARPARLLDAADPRHQHGRAAQGPLADVHPPRRHHMSNLHLLPLPLYSCRQPDSRTDGCSRSLPPRKQPLPPPYPTVPNTTPR